ncbi:MAG: thymidine phosphorylase [Kiritimatiellae bacterium]|nr:thymidine phosphorylase [Kiritimatiellia bacterium]
MVPQWVIEKKRDGGRLDEGEIRAFIEGFTAGEIPDYQMSALAMAVFFRGMDAKETNALTEAMRCSGDTLDWAGCPLPTADKHSTGGIGDNLSLMLAPLAATQGVAVPMISGRGLGITGGTLDKLDSIPGYDTRLGIERFREIVTSVGCSIIGQTERLAPADKKLYALRDVTGTVPSIPLITASIMSKKLAEGAASLVFDVKFGRAAFMKTKAEAQRLAESLVQTGRAAGRRCVALLTRMDCPLGRAAGNAVEVAEAVETLRGKGPSDKRLLTLALTEEMVASSYPKRARREIAAALEKALDDGSALRKFREMVEAHGGDARFLDDPSRLPQAGAALEIPAPAAGFVQDVDANAIGRVVLQLGGGRKAVTDAIDYAAGVDRLVQQGEAVEKGQTLMRLLAKDAAAAEALAREAAAAVTLGEAKPEPPSLIAETFF